MNAFGSERVISIAVAVRVPVGAVPGLAGQTPEGDGASVVGLEVSPPVLEVSGSLVEGVVSAVFDVVPIVVVGGVLVEGSALEEDPGTTDCGPVVEEEAPV
jgi:hypothetical protein